MEKRTKYLINPGAASSVFQRDITLIGRATHQFSLRHGLPVPGDIDSLTPPPKREKLVDHGGAVCSVVDRQNDLVDNEYTDVAGERAYVLNRLIWSSDSMIFFINGFAEVTL